MSMEMNVIAQLVKSNGWKL